ncbi:MAG: oxidative damage protection protein [Sandaracinaceae bacterium]|nr:MAG: oxidative damage protection protein [Sandaracinaceae bacterium]HBQ15997.1 oxidative damage protection protein [Myxococcales bacterium]
MADTVFCVKTQKEGEKLPRPPFPNELGQRIHDSISQDGWRLWIAHSTMLINEFRIDVSSKQGTEFLLKQCEEFFFGEGSELPPDFKPADASEDGEGS